MKKQKQLPSPKPRSVDNETPKKEIVKYTEEETKDIVLSMVINYNPRSMLEELSELLPKWYGGTDAERKAIKKDVDEKVTAALYAFEADTHMQVMEGVSERYRAAAKELCDQFIHDFDCKNDSEKMLAETAAVAAMRYLDASRRLNNVFDVDNYVTSNKTAYMAMLSKERDRAHRQYLSTVTTLKQLKAPAIEMNIKTHTAILAQNQQINLPQASKENNDAK